MLLHEADGRGSNDAARDGDEASLDEAGERGIVCRGCQAEISRRRFVFAAREGRSVHVFPNPLGVMQEIVTVRRVIAVVSEGAPTTDFTWFSGRAWTVAYCASCRVHLGWRFDSVASGGTDAFYGLLVARLAGL